MLDRKCVARSCANMVEADSAEKYCESCVRGRNKKFLTRKDFEAAQKATPSL